MIVTCPNCSSFYNNQTVNKCPACSVKPYREIDNRSKADKKFSNQLAYFLKEDSYSKRKTATGYQHKVKTGGGGRI
jgi:hypothetical protein